MNDIKTYANDMTPIKLMQMTIDIMANGEYMHDKFSRIAHMMSFQGQKRYHRVKSLEDRCFRVEIQHYCIDMFSMDLEPNWDIKVTEPKDIEEFLNIYLEWEIESYKDLNSIHNDLVVKGYNQEAKFIKEYLCNNVKEIEKIRRWIYDFSNSGWSWHHMKVVDSKLHDKIKECENK